MSASLQIQSLHNSPQTDGGVWYQVHSEREEICEALLREPWPSDQFRAVLGETVNVEQLQKRLRLIDDALDRLMAGSYGHSVFAEGRSRTRNYMLIPPCLIAKTASASLRAKDSVPASVLNRCDKDDNSNHDCA